MQPEDKTTRIISRRAALFSAALAAFFTVLVIAAHRAGVARKAAITNADRVIHDVVNNTLARMHRDLAIGTKPPTARTTNDGNTNQPSPTPKPAKAPVRKPTQPPHPTKKATKGPTRESKAPTTRAPSDPPTPRPTREPTAPTTPRPTPEPTGFPTSFPTTETPSGAPSVTPTVSAPSGAPSGTPSQTPSRTPSTAPGRAKNAAAEQQGEGGRFPWEYVAGGVAAAVTTGYGAYRAKKRYDKRKDQASSSALAPSERAGTPPPARGDSGRGGASAFSSKQDPSDKSKGRGASGSTKGKGWRAGD